MNDRTDAIAALAAIQDSRQRLAARAASPQLRHLAFAGVLTAVVSSPAAPQGTRTIIVALVVIAITLIVRWDRRRTGIFVHGLHPGAPRWMTLVMVALTVAAYLLSDSIGNRHAWSWAPVAVGLVAGLVGYGASLVWERIYLRDLERDA